jgi:hypothetical protein
VRHQGNAASPQRPRVTHCPASPLTAAPNGWRLSGDGGEADGVRCSRGLGRILLRTGWHGTPFLRRDIGHVLRKRPPVASRILGGVLPLAEWFVGG